MADAAPHSAFSLVELHERLSIIGESYMEKFIYGDSVVTDFPWHSKYPDVSASSSAERILTRCEADDT